MKVLTFLENIPHQDKLSVNQNIWIQVRISELKYLFVCLRRGHCFAMSLSVGKSCRWVPSRSHLSIWWHACLLREFMPSSDTLLSGSGMGSPFVCAGAGFSVVVLHVCDFNDLCWSSWVAFVWAFWEFDFTFQRYRWHLP